MDPEWLQISVEFTDYSKAELITADRLLPVMERAASWWFIRKAPCWRLRYLPTDPTQANELRKTVSESLNSLHSAGEITDWVETIYEPEIHAFGGTNAMAAAHRLFHHDSQQILSRPNELNHRREHSILLCSELLRAAGQDWYEQGDVWARVASNRPGQSPAPDEQRTLATDLQRLMAVDMGRDSALVRPGGQLAHLAGWVESFRVAGESLIVFARRGQLTRGLRATLAHHVIFHWNRLGLSYETQSRLAAAAREAVFGTHDQERR
ncbi:thiopeptide-type bacteriocin biosynthesis protein [Actinokineospora globicatena]|uniref:thiopeptide-type bacteriocin biosynthesis protein n=1 Tax=Actinokineospora globicatena TaxID=103729 RepID=UPI0020A23A5E|nr:thiopeptide-type bacteriocin biosynthesis protein [Actinokineospora globicatena]MCP2303319.1 thiopeptide-type bacteriocin biosynthesis domain-containing protein [Actinokineospora globicatena]GLW79548.1 hypothetical protein Aglo01_40300 [Actinokineospora globicatena]GLW86042.1 hypothetical protein Aglo02_36810 [Actinokineospora globicatena]